MRDQFFDFDNLSLAAFQPIIFLLISSRLPPSSTLPHITFINLSKPGHLLAYVRSCFEIVTLGV